jgi:putative ABC transport system substrate-binding protein
MGEDPVATGLVASLARPGGNVTGVSFLVVELHAKRLELISEMVPQVRVIGLIVNPASPQTERVIQSMEEASRSKGIQLIVLTAGIDREIRPAFDSFVQRSVGALVVQADPFFITQPQLVAELSLRHAVPAIYEGRSFVELGGLISYGASLQPSIAKSAFTQARFSKVRSLPTSRFRNRPSSSWSSISRPLRRSASRCRRRCARSPTR